MKYTFDIDYITLRSNSTKIYQTFTKAIYYVNGYIIYFDVRSGFTVRKFKEIELKVYNEPFKSQGRKITLSDTYSTDGSEGRRNKT